MARPNTWQVGAGRKPLLWATGSMALIGLSHQAGSKVVIAALVFDVIGIGIFVRLALLGRVSLTEDRLRVWGVIAAPKFPIGDLVSVGVVKSRVGMASTVRNVLQVTTVAGVRNFPDINVHFNSDRLDLACAEINLAVEALRS